MGDKNRAEIHRMFWGCDETLPHVDLTKIDAPLPEDRSHPIYSHIEPSQILVPLATDAEMASVKVQLLKHSILLDDLQTRVERLEETTQWLKR